MRIFLSKKTQASAELQRLVRKTTQGISDPTVKSLVSMLLFSNYSKKAEQMQNNITKKYKEFIKAFSNDSAFSDKKRQAFEIILDVL